MRDIELERKVSLVPSSEIRGVWNYGSDIVIPAAAIRTLPKKRITDHRNTLWFDWTWL